MHSASFLSLTAILAALPLCGQKAPVVPTRPSVPTSPTTTTNPTNTTNTNPTTNTPSNTIARPIYLSGKVVLQDGTPPPDLVRIERICSGNPRPQGYTDSKGRFQFQLDSAFGVEPEASDSSGRSLGSIQPRTTSSMSSLSRGDLAGCDLRAVLPGFISGTVSLAAHGIFDNPDVGTIVLRRASNVDGTTISMTTLNAPKDALKAYEKGRESLRKNKPEEAQRAFLKAVEVYPKYAMAWFQLGQLQNGGQALEAENSFQQAISADPKFVSPYLELTLIYERRSQWDKALDVSSRMVKLNASDFPEAHFYRGVAQFNLKDLEGAHKSVAEAVKLDTQHQFPQSEKLLGIILARKRDLPGAVEHLKSYLQYAPNASDTAEVQKQLAQLEKQPVAAK